MKRGGTELQTDTSNNADKPDRKVFLEQKRPGKRRNRQQW